MRIALEVSVSKKDHHIPQGAFSRATKLFASGARIAVREVTGQISGKDNVATRIKQSHDLVSCDLARSHCSEFTK